MYLVTGQDLHIVHTFCFPEHGAGDTLFGAYYFHITQCLPSFPWVDFRGEEHYTLYLISVSASLSTLLSMHLLMTELGKNRKC